MALKFSDGTSHVVTFPTGEFEEVDNSFGGTQFRHDVIAEGSSQLLFASATLHDRILKAGLAPGAQIRITRVGEMQQTRWSAALVEEGAPEPAPTSGAQPGPSPSGPAPKATSSPATQVDFATLARTLDACVKFVDMNCPVTPGEAGIDFSPEDIRALSITLFLETSRKGAWIQGAKAPEAPQEPAKAPVVVEEEQGGLELEDQRERLSASLKAFREKFGGYGMTGLCKMPEIQEMVPRNDEMEFLFTEVPGKYLDSVIKMVENLALEMEKADEGNLLF